MTQETGPDVCDLTCETCGRKLCTGAGKLSEGEGGGRKEEGGTLDAERRTPNAQRPTLNVEEVNLGAVIPYRRTAKRPTGSGRPERTAQPTRAAAKPVRPPAARPLPNPGEGFGLLFGNGKLRCYCACARTVDAESRIRLASGSRDPSAGLQMLAAGSLDWLSAWEELASRPSEQGAIFRDPGAKARLRPILRRAISAVRALLPEAARSMCAGPGSKSLPYSCVSPLCCLGPYPGTCPGMRKSIRKMTGGGKGARATEGCGQ